MHHLDKQGPSLLRATLNPLATGWFVLLSLRVRKAGQWSKGPGKTAHWSSVTMAN